ncbi:MAG: IS30 family transposase [Thermoanaerobaculia bacterium]
MGETARIRFTPRQRAELWDRWKGGQCVADIARALDRRNKSGVYRVLALNGGIVPRPRRRAAIALRIEEREEISRGIAAGDSIRRIAKRLGRAPSTVSRELKRHGGRDAYRASEADGKAWERAQRPKRCRLATHGRLRWRVAEKLARQWSPEQISGWLRQQFPADPTMRISHETIYKSLFVQARGALKKELMAHLRTQRQLRQAKGGTSKQGLGSIVDAVSIRERPAEVEDRAVPGHWEGDLLSGSNNTHIATLVERHTRFAMLIKVNGKDTASVVGALAKQVRRLPAQLRRSLTWDRGKEMADHKRFTFATDVKVYFCDPRSPWQRGSNENTNGLLRQYFPKGKDLSIYPQAYLDKIAKRLNDRPRKTLGFESPADRLHAVLQ